MDHVARGFMVAGDVAELRARLDAGGIGNQTDPATKQTLLVTAAHEGWGKSSASYSTAAPTAATVTKVGPSRAHG